MLYFIHNIFELVLEKILYCKYCSGFVATVLFVFCEKYFIVNMYCSGLIHMGIKHLRNLMRMLCRDISLRYIYVIS